jgi:hypothetical protein
MEAVTEEKGGRPTMRYRTIVYALASLAAFAVAVGAGWKPW